MYLRTYVIFTLFLLGLPWTSPVLAAEALVVATREETLTNRFAERVLSAAYARLDIKIKFLPYPSGRSVVEASEGRADGEAARLGAVLDQYTNLRKVPVPLFYSELSAFSHENYEINIFGWSSLDDRKLTTVRGFKFVENKLAGQALKIVRTSSEAVQLVENDRVEAAVLNQFLGRLAIAKTGAQHVKVHTPPLERLPVYHLLHKKHEALIPKLTAVLKTMERDGVIRTMWEDFTTREILKASSQKAQSAPDVYVLNTSTGAPYTTSGHGGFQDLVVAEVFRRIGLKGRVLFYDASARALINANNNVDHGVAMRIKGLEKKYANLVRVEERLIKNDFVAYSQGLDFVTDDWAKLEPYVAAYINGWVIFERNLGAAQKKETVKEPGHMFAMLDKGRVDLVLYERWQGLQWAKESGVKVTVHEPPLASLDMFMYVHKDHAHLAPKMAQALRDMKSDGTYQEIFDKTLAPLNGGE